MGLNLYPRWVKVDPNFAHELLAEIRRDLGPGRSLDDEQRAYLLDAIGKILRGVDPKRALYLTRLRKTGGNPFSDRNAEIYNAVARLKEGGMSLRQAYLKVSVGTRKRGATESLSAKAVEKVYREIQRRISKSRKVPTQSGVEK